MHVVTWHLSVIVPPAHSVTSLLHPCEGRKVIQRFTSGGDLIIGVGLHLAYFRGRCPHNDTRTQCYSLSHTQIVFITLKHIHFRCFGSLARLLRQYVSPRACCARKRGKCWHAVADAIHTCLSFGAKVRNTHRI